MGVLKANALKQFARVIVRDFMRCDNHRHTQRIGTMREHSEQSLLEWDLGGSVALRPNPLARPQLIGNIAMGRLVVDTWLHEIDHLDKEIAAQTRELERRAAGDARARWLQTVPGIGGTGLQLWGGKVES